MNTEHTNQSSQAEPATHSPIALQSIPKRQRDFTAENIRDIAHECMRIGDNEQAAVVFAIADALRDGNLIIQSPAQQQAEPVALSLPFFAYDSETGFERFATDAEAKQYVQDGIDECRSNMLQGEAWPSEIENLCWGVVLGTTKEIKLCETEDGSGDYYSDYVLTDAAQPPAVAVPEGYALVPVEPTEEQWGGLARDIMMAFDLGGKSPASLLKNMRLKWGELPEWMRKELNDPESNAVLSKGTRAVLIYRAMLAAAPQAVATGWIDPNDKTQKQYLPHIGEPVLFCHDGVTYYGQHTGGSFETANGFAVKFFETWDCLWMYPPAAAQKGGA